MTIVAAYIYRNGHRAGTIALDGPLPAMAAESEFVWIGLVAPAEDEMLILKERFDLHPLAVEDALQAHPFPKLAVYGDQLFAAVRTARLENDEIKYGETSIFVGKHHVITVRNGSNRAHTQLRADLEAAPELLAQGVDYVLHGIIDYVVDGYTPIVQAIEDDVFQMERNALDSFLSRDDIKRLFALRQQLIKFHRVLDATTELVRKLANLAMPCIDQEARAYFSNVHDHIRRVESAIRALTAALESVFEIGSLLEQHRQGVITRQLAAWAAILAVPTAIAGIYGMNFENMPELKTQYGYYVVLGAIGIICGALFWRFKKAKWL